MMSKLKIALLQSNLSWNDPQKNISHANEMAACAFKQGAELILLPEVFPTGFSGIQGKEAREAGILASSFLEEFACKHKVYIGGSLPFFDEACRQEDIAPYNMFRLFGPKGHLGDYAKNYLISFLGEDKRYKIGKGSLTLDIKGVRVSFFICYDLRFPGIFSSLAEKTDLYVVVANWPKERQLHWDTLLKARAIENQAYVAGVNRVGMGGGLEFEGGSTIISPRGLVIAKGDDKERIVSADVSKGEVDDYRLEFPCLQDRRQQTIK